MSQIVERNITLMQLTPKDIMFLRGGEDVVNEYNKIKVGDIIVLPSNTVEDMTFDSTIFRVVAVVDTFKGVSLNSYVLKEVAQDKNGTWNDIESKRNKLTINRHLCESLGVNYERGLELWPNYMNFVPFNMLNGHNRKLNDEIDYNDMGTYPYNLNSGIVEKICIKFNGYRVNGDEVSSQHLSMKIDTFISSLHLTFRVGRLNTNRVVAAKVICPDKTSNELYMEIDVSCLGIRPEEMSGFSINEILNVVIETHDDMLPINPFSKTKTRYKIRKQSNTELFDALDEYIDRMNRECANKINREVKRGLQMVWY